MTMMDGHRLPADTTPRGERAGVDISGMYPAIAIGRVDTILDGASALYGAEAVSGVINMVPRKDFEGLTDQSWTGGSLWKTARRRPASAFWAACRAIAVERFSPMEMRNTERMRFTDRPRYIIDTKNPWARHTTVSNDFYNVGSMVAVLEGRLRRRRQPCEPDSRAGSFAHWRVHDSSRTRSDLEATGDYGYASQAGHRGHNWAGQYGRDRRPARAQDPTCAYGFGAGHDDEGPPPISPYGPFFDWGNGEDAHNQQAAMRGRRSSAPTGVRTSATYYGETYTYNDVSRHGNFLNGYNDPNDPAYHCRMVDSDYQDIQAESDRQKGFGYFEYEFNDYITVRGEFVSSSVDYNTRLYAPGFNDFDSSSGGLVNDRMGIAVGSNPGNPFRAFADGSTINDYYDGVNGVWDPTDNNIFLPPGDDQYWPGVSRDIWPGGSNTGTARPNRQLDFRDLNGNGRYDYLEEPGELLVFAQDADGDGIPDRDWDGDGMADANVQRDPRARVVLMGMDDSDGDGIPDRFDPDGGGIPFYEDVRFEERRLFAFPKHPRNNNLDWAENDGILHFLRRTSRQDIRLRLGSEIRIPETDWVIDADWIWAQGVRETNQFQEVTAEMVQALRCNAGPNQNSCWNPFGTTYMMIDENGFPIGDPSNKFPAPNDPGWTPPDHDFVNTEDEHRLAGNVMAYNIQDLGMTIVDLVGANSNLFDLWYNDQPVGLAIGMHWRLEEEEYRPHALAQAAVGGNKFALRKSEQESQAVFAEVSLPLISHETWGEMEAQVAVRYSEITAEGIYGQPGSSKFTTTIPKLAIRYAPTDYLAMRGSITQGFVTPGLYALFGDAGIETVGTVRDYICDYLPEIQDCIDAGASKGGGTPNVRTRSGSSPDLDPETSDLYNLGFSLKFLDGDLVFDVDYTSVEFRGQIEPTGPGDQVGLNENGFTAYVEAACPGTLVDWDNDQKHGDPRASERAALTQEQFRDSEWTNPQDLACRRNAAISWLQSGANAGAGELSFAGGRLDRGKDGSPIILDYVEGAWTAQGQRVAETMIYGVRYAFELPDNRFTNWIGDDKGAFLFTLSATQFLTQELTKFKSFGCDDAGRNAGGFCIRDNVLAGITVDGVGNRNSQYFSPPNMHLMADLPPTPEWRAQASLRWFRGPHTAQLMVRWHDMVKNINVAWDAMKERERQDPRTVIASWTWNTADRASYPHHVPYRGYEEVTIPGTDIVKRIPNEEQSQRCAFQPWPVCKIDSRHYWDVSYSYRRPDFLGFSSVMVNAAIRNIFDTYPDPITQFSAHEPYLDNIMGRSILVRLNVSL